MGKSKTATNNVHEERSRLLANEPAGNDIHGYGAAVNEISGCTDEADTVLPLSDATILEPPDKHRSRWRSIRIVYFTMFLSAVTFTMTMPTLWPFLQVVDEDATPKLLGWVVASYSIGQLAASPFFGFWSARRHAKEPLVASLFLQIGSNLFYAYIQSVRGNGGTMLILARVIIGFSAGNAAVVRSYVSAATTLAERTSAMTMTSMFQSIGFILGPVIQTGLVAVGYPGPAEKVWFHFNMYTSPALLATVLAVLNLVLLILVFRVHTISDTGPLTINVHDDDRETVQEIDEAEASPGDDYSGPPDYLIVFVVMYLFFVVFFMFTIFETIGTPLTMDMYGWTKSQASLYMGIMLGVSGFVAIGVFAVIRILSNRGFNERKVMIAGYVFCLIGFVTYLPWGNVQPVRGFAPIFPPATASPLVHNTTAAIYFAANNDFSPVSETGAEQLRKEILTAAYAFADFQQQQQQQQQNEKSDLRGSETLADRFFRILTQKQTSDYFRSRDKNTASDVDQVADHQTVDAAGGLRSEEAVTTEHDERSSVSAPTATTLPQYSTDVTGTDVTGTDVTCTDVTGTDVTGTDVTGTVTPTTPGGNTTVEPQGCPWEFGWCGQVPQVRLFQFILGTFFIAVGYPICNVQTYSLFSKVLGPQPQGLWMGILTGCGSLARTLGPVFVSQVYDAWGPRVTFASTSAVLLLTIGMALAFYSRLLPYAVSPYRKRPRAGSDDSEGVPDGAAGSGCCCGGRLKKPGRDDVESRRTPVYSGVGSLQ